MYSSLNMKGQKIGLGWLFSRLDSAFSFLKIFYYNINLIFCFKLMYKKIYIPFLNNIKTCRKSKQKISLDII